ncbi:MAG TPA: feruloyl-CoA synthase [Phenylobacterium sp.]|nr:feruloyl-CoA synthase [Phenylobacterium sp.]
MDGETQLKPFRDPRYAPRRLEVEQRPGGEVILSNPTPFDTAFQTMTAALERWARETPDRLWLAERAGLGWRQVGYAEGAARVAAIAGGLAGLGLQRGDILLILARNGVDHALVAYAAMSQGVAIAPVSPQYGLPGANLSRLAGAVETLRPKAVFTEDAALFGGALAADFLAGLPVIAAANARAGDIPLADLLKASPVAAVASPDDTAKLLLTSGSTGRPKAVIGAHRNIALNAAQIAACYADPDPPVVVNAAPWSHSLGANAILHMVTHRGGALYIDAGQPVAGRFDETLRNLGEIAPTYHNMVPAGWALLASELERDEALARTFFSRVRVLQYGGAALGQSVADRIQAVALATCGEQISFASGYGATETGPTASNVHWTNGRMGMIGLPVPGTAVRLVPTGDKLEFRVRGPQVSAGYLNEQELSAQAFDEEGFYRLGDAARFVDPDDPHQGLAFDGRLVENFKLASGTFVSAGSLRVAAVSAMGAAAVDAVVCGEGRAGVGLLVFANPGLAHEAAREAIRAGLERFNGQAAGSGGKVLRALVLADAPDATSGEITEKGYINQALARSRRAADVERLFAEPPDGEVLSFA